MRCYLGEAKWFIKGYLPPFEEYLDIAFTTSTYHYLTTSSFMGMGSARKEDFEWLSKKPKMLVAALTICRLVDDASSYEVHMQIRSMIINILETYFDFKKVRFLSKKKFI